MCKRLFAGFTAICLFLSLMPLYVSAEESEAISGSCGEEAIWTFDEVSGTLTISGTGRMDDATDASNYPYHAYADDIKSVVVADGITYIGSPAFWGFKNLVEVSIAGSVETIGVGAFSGCSNLKEIVLPEGIKTLNDQVFMDCSSLTRITIPSTLTSVALYAFEDCTNLEEVYISDLAAWCEIEFVDNPLSFGGDLYLDSELVTELNITQDIETVCYYAFNGCGSLTSVVFSENLKKIETLAFQDCANLSQIKFCGAPPVIGEGAFYGVTATVSYPADNAAWTEAVIQNYEDTLQGTLTWTPYEAEHTHAMVKTEAVAATCQAAGNNAYYTCSLCEKVYKDEAGTAETTVEAETLAVADHTGGTATCTAQAVCQVCGKGYGEMASHSYNEVWNADAENHWHKCANCDATSTKTAHEFQWVIDKEATAEETGLKHEECTVCYYKRSENTVIDIVVHVHTMEKTASKSATCEEDGNIAYWSCTDCGGIYADKDGTIETTMEKVTVEATGHAYDDGLVTKEPTEIETGTRTFTCENCGGTKTEEIPALGGEEDPTEPSEPEDPTEPEETVNVTRIAGDNRCETAFKAADRLKAVLGVEKFDAIIIASGNNFADALAGSYLAAVKKAPILLYRKGFEDENADYVAENLASGGTVYILGGTAAVPEAMETALQGVTPKRLAGDNRYDTNLKILEAAGITGDRILVATGLDFADCLAASATGLPILMVNSRLNALTDDQKAFLEANSGKDITVIGGEAAVSQSLYEELENYGTMHRISGSRREETALNVAKEFYPEAASVVIAYSRNFPDALCGGPLAYALNCPLLLVNKNTESSAAEYVQEKKPTSGYVLGGTAALSDATVNKVFAN